MNIGIVIPEIGGYSSISIEFHKWHDVMTSLGHNIYIITGKSRTVLKNMTVMKELYHENEYNLLFSSKLFEFLMMTLKLFQYLIIFPLVFKQLLIVGQQPMILIVF